MTEKNATQGGGGDALERKILDELEQPNPNGKLNKEYEKRRSGRPSGRSGHPSAHRQAKRGPIAELVEDDEDGVLAEVRRAWGAVSEDDEQADHCAQVLTRAQVLNLPPPEFLVENLLSEVGYTVVWGEPGVFKTFMLIHISEGVRAGEPPFYGKAKRGAVLFYEGEGLDQFPERLAAYDDKHGRSSTDGAPVWYLAELLDVTDPRSVARVVRTARRMAEDTGERVRLVAIDPLIEHMSGDENAEGMTEASKGLRVIARVLGCCVLAAHHSNASGERGRGSDQLRARAHGYLRMERISADKVGLVAEKQRNAPHYAWELLHYEHKSSVLLSPSNRTEVGEYHREREEERAQHKAVKQSREQKAKNAVTEEDDEKVRQLLLDVLASIDEPKSHNKVVDLARERDPSVSKNKTEDKLREIREGGEVNHEKGPRGSILYPPRPS